MILRWPKRRARVWAQRFAQATTNAFPRGALLFVPKQDYFRVLDFLGEWSGSFSGYASLYPLEMFGIKRGRNVRIVDRRDIGEHLNKRV